ncbi:MAG: YegS/Rv2252/BmrU family lipid kinase [Clostridia bacterium]|nr:YegS/Rv2252/BmrU family lipid kinase [Clostridia bacterium]
MKRKVLLIVNPCSGQMKVNKMLTEIVDVFTKAGFMTTVLTTTRLGDATEYAKEYSKQFDLIVCAGGDGTFNETVAGVIKSGVRTPIGYIPCGSTNDFAQSLGLSKNVVQAAKDIVSGYPITFDVGDFNGRPFTYVASFGAVTSVSYETPQNVKNALGHLAYILGGINSIPSIRATNIRIETSSGKVFDGDYIFGAISNSKSIAGILTLSDKFVDMADGKFELLLVKMPMDMIELGEIISILSTQNFNNDSLVTFVNDSEFKITTSGENNWTLDGEYQQGCEEIFIKNQHNAIDLVMKKRQK